MAHEGLTQYFKDITAMPEAYQGIPKDCWIKIESIRRERLQNTLNAPLNPYAEALLDLFALPNIGDFYWEAHHDVITLSGNLPPAIRPRIEQQLRAFQPWKKGPFSLFEIMVDAEWRSDMKWTRLREHVGSLEDQTVCDIGCNNAYYMFRMAAMTPPPKLIVGLEPYAKHWYTFQWLNHFARIPFINFELLGVEHCDLFPSFFDTIFCLGILYHHTDPIGILRKIRAALKHRGRLFVDCQGIPGDQPVALTPSGRYAGAGGVWFLPTLTTLTTWLKRAGFQKVDIIFAQKLEPSEQRRSSWAQIDSLAEFLDPTDAQKTIEGYPAPWRFYVEAR